MSDTFGVFDREAMHGILTQLVKASERDDPACPIKGLPSIRFDMRLSRESAADQRPRRRRPIRDDEAAGRVSRRQRPG